jgi:hypothetical protein
MDPFTSERPSKSFPKLFIFDINYNVENKSAYNFIIYFEWVEG